MSEPIADAEAGAAETGATEATEHTIQIELEGLISLLAQHLYADPDVFLREMIQNAHDSISRRAALAEERGELTSEPDGAAVSGALPGEGRSGLARSRAGSG